MWLSGYYNSSVRNTVLDLDEFAGLRRRKDYCKTTPRAPYSQRPNVRSG
jgi:hypothetical protein